MFSYRVVRITSRIVSCSDVFTKSVMTGSICLTLVKVLTQFTVYSIDQVPLSTCAVHYEGADFAITRIAKRTNPIVKRS